MRAACTRRQHLLNNHLTRNTSRVWYNCVTGFHSTISLSYQVCDLGEGDMAADTITFDEVLQLVQRLSPTDQVRLRAVLPRTDEDAAWAIQRQKNQAAIDLLDSWRAEANAAT